MYFDCVIIHRHKYNVTNSSWILGLQVLRKVVLKLRVKNVTQKINTSFPSKNGPRPRTSSCTAKLVMRFHLTIITTYCPDYKTFAFSLDQPSM